MQILLLDFIIIDEGVVLEKDYFSMILNLTKLEKKKKTGKSW